MRKPKGSRGKVQPKHPAVPPETIDPDAVEIDGDAYTDVDWDELQRHSVDLDPSLVEAIRSRRTLKQLTLRVGVEQIEEARRVAEQTGIPYQAVLRRWLSQGASIARSSRLRRKKAADG